MVSLNLEWIMMKDHRVFFNEKMYYYKFKILIVNSQGSPILNVGLEKNDVLRSQCKRFSASFKKMFHKNIVHLFQIIDLPFSKFIFSKLFLCHFSWRLIALLNL
jgi:hypothetical protein